LQTVVGATTMLMNHAQTTTRDPRQSMLSLLHNQGQRLQALIEDVLNLSRIDSEGIRLQRERIEGRCRLCIVSSANMHIHSRKIHVVAHGALSEIYGDMARIEQIFHNILDNAAKHDHQVMLRYQSSNLLQFHLLSNLRFVTMALPLHADEYTRVF
jgi:two-component system phosphate regulon sensor histidine kinase PhoR